MASDFGLVVPGGSVSGDPTLLAQIDDVCFVCGRPQAHTRASNATACADCRSRARLLRGRARLADVLLPTDHPAEGVICCLINPVEIDGRRGWLAFASAEWRVHEEQYPSSDFFDFPMLHFAPQRTTARALRPAELLSAIETRGFDALVDDLSFEASLKLRELLSAWEAVTAGLAVQRKFPAPRSSADVEQLYDALLTHIRKAAVPSSQLAMQMLERVAVLQRIL